MQEKLMSRSLLLLVLFMSAALVFAGGQGEQESGAGDAATEQAEGTAGPDLTQKQAPMLEQEVDSGNLPPLEERLPEEPLLREVYSELGAYGGTMTLTKVGSVTNPDPLFAHMLAFNTDLSEARPNFAKELEVSEDGTTFTIHLREGVRWSDGEPFTTEDIAFYFNDVMMNEEYLPQGPDDYLTSGDTPASLNVVDDYTVQFIYPKPNATFRRDLASYWGKNLVRTPKHYLQQFHPDYTDPEEVQAKAEDRGFEDWTQLFEDRWDTEENTNPDRPTVAAWDLVQGYPDSPMIYRRNPYYWAVDSEGRQLPYVDELQYLVTEDQEVHKLRVSQGELDFERRMGAADIPVLRRNADQYGFEIVNWQADKDSADLLALNDSHPDPKMAQFLGDPQFRKAVSLGIDRERINELVYRGLAGDPTQPGPPEGTRFYNPELSNAYTDYDPDRARQMLTELGLEEGEDGRRTFPDGSEFQINFVVVPSWKQVGDVTELFMEDLNNLGIQTNLRAVERNAWYDNVLQPNDFDATVWEGNPASFYLSDPRDLIAHRWYTSFWAPGWATWFSSGGDSGVEPPEPMKEARSLFDELLRTVDPDEQERLSDQITDIAAENLWVIGTVEPPPLPVVKNENLHNVPREGIFTWDTFGPVQRFDQFWFGN